MPGMVTPATIGWNIVSSSWRPRKYQGAFEGLGVRLKLASVSSGALTKAEKTSRKAVTTREATNSTTSRCGQVWTLSVGWARTSWIDPDLTTVSSRWVWPSGPVATGGAAARAVVVVAVAGARSWVATPPPPAAAPSGPSPGVVSLAWVPAPASSEGAPPPFLAAALALASWARLRRCSGISVMSLLLVLQRPGDAAVLAHPPEVHRHEDDGHEREHQDVEHVPAQQRVGADLDPAEEHEAHLAPEDG